MIQNIMVLCVGSLSLVAGVNSTSGAVLVPTSQNRTIAMSLGVPGAGTLVTNHLAAPDFGLFDQTNTVSGVIRRRYHYLVQSDQTSQIGASTIAAAGQATVVPTPYFCATAQSDFAVSFTLTQPVTYTLAGNLTWSEVYPLLASSPSPVVTLTGPAGSHQW